MNNSATEHGMMKLIPFHFKSTVILIIPIIIVKNYPKLVFKKFPYDISSKCCYFHNVLKALNNSYQKTPDSPS